MTKEQIYELAKNYIIAGFRNPNNDYKITDTIQTLTESKQNYFWELVDMGVFASSNAKLIQTNKTTN